MACHHRFAVDRTEGGYDDLTTTSWARILTHITNDQNAFLNSKHGMESRKQQLRALRTAQERLEDYFGEFFRYCPDCGVLLADVIADLGLNT